MAVANVPFIYNVTLTTAGTEYSQSLNSLYGNTFTVQCRQGVDIRMAFSSGATSTTYFTIPAGSSYTFDKGIAGIKTLYFQCATAGPVTVEILYFE